MNVLMVGVDKSTQGGMWTVVENYLNDSRFVEEFHLKYIPTVITDGSAAKRLAFGIGGVLRVMRTFRQSHIDILHVHMSERASVLRKGLLMYYARKKGSRVVLHMHGAEFEDLYYKMNEKKKRQTRAILDLADRVLILGDYWKEFIGSLLSDPSKIRVVYNAVEVPTRYSYQDNSNQILFLGAVSKRKGIDVLLQALAMKSDELSSMSRVQIFGPDVEANVETKIREMNLGSWVSYCGWLSGDRKPEVLSASAVMVLPSYNEGLPMTILEAMSYGIPSVTTTVAAIPEAVENEKNGLLVKPGNVEALAEALVRIMRDRDMRVAMSRQAYQDAMERFSLQRHMEDIRTIYQECMRS